MTKKATIKELKDYLKSCGWDDRKGNRAKLMANASSISYFRKDEIEIPNNIAKEICLHRAVKLERVAFERAGKPEYAKDVKSRIKHAEEYRELAKTY